MTSPPIGDGQTGILADAPGATALYRTELIAGDTSVPHGVGDAFSALIAGGAPVGTALGQLRALIACSVGAPHLRIAGKRRDLDAGRPDRRRSVRPIDRRPRNALRWVMGFDFILMLTENDRTIPDARARLEEALEGGVRHIGFKDVGLPLPDLRALADAIRAAGGRSYLEVVSLDAESEMASARAAVDLDVDVLLGGTRAAEVTEVTRHHPVPILSVPGPDHRPSQRSGRPRTRHRRLGKGTGGTGTRARARPAGLPVYRRRPPTDGRRQRGGCKTRHRGRQQSTARNGSRTAAAAGAQGFTVGTAALAGAFPAETEGFAGQVRAILAITARAQALSTAPRRIALVAHDTRKTHLSAWVTRHAGRLSAHRIVCTGGTGRVLARTAPGLTIQRLQRGGRGGDQQLAAMIATGELDAVVFFADPTVPHSGRCGPAGADPADGDP